MTEQPHPIRPLPAPKPLTSAQSVRFCGTDEVDVLQAMTQWCLQRRRAITILAMNWSYTEAQNEPDDDITVVVTYELVDLELLARIRSGEVVHRDGQLVDEDGSVIT